MLDDAGWRAMYAAGERFHTDASILLRLAIWSGAMLALFAAVSAWPAKAGERRRLAGLVLAGLIACGTASAVAVAVGGGLDLAHDPTHGWTTLLIAAAVTAALAWAWTARRPDGRALPVASVATAAALIAGSVVREAPRLALIEHPRA